MKLKLVKHYVQNKIKDIEGEIYDHQFVIDFDNPCEEELKHRQWAIKELSIDLEAYRHYLNLLNSGEAPTINLNRQGKWIEINHTCGYMRTCSECGWSTDTNWMPGSLENEKFCPNCGAEMR